MRRSEFSCVDCGYLFISPIISVRCDEAEEEEREELVAAILHCDE